MPSDTAAADHPRQWDGGRAVESVDSRRLPWARRPPRIRRCGLRWRHVRAFTALVLGLFLVFSLALYPYRLWELLPHFSFPWGRGGDKWTSTRLARVDLGYARYRGTRLLMSVETDGKGRKGVAVNQFLGLRYAAPPLGQRRWRSPVEPSPERDKVLTADSYGDVCLATGGGYVRGSGWSEDCLYANVWAPAGAKVVDPSQRGRKGSGLAVWVFIQGGGYVSNSNANWNGSEIVARSMAAGPKEGVVFVSFNYRVGMFGFLGGEEVHRDGAGELNVGLRDQRFLLEWVHRHVHKFGGDRDRVVIHGASAGAGSVAMHMLDPRNIDAQTSGQQLFVGAVAESLFFPAQPRCEELGWQFERAAKAAGCMTDGGPKVMDCLRQADVGLLQEKVNVPSPFPGRSGNPLFYWTPCVDGELIPDNPYSLFSRGLHVKVPVMFGFDTDGKILAGLPGRFDRYTLTMNRPQQKDQSSRLALTTGPTLSSSSGTIILTWMTSLPVICMTCTSGPRTNPRRKLPSPPTARPPSSAPP